MRPEAGPDYAQCVDDGTERLGSVLEVNDLAIRFGRTTIFSGLSCYCHARDRLLPLDIPASPVIGRTRDEDLAARSTGGPGCRNPVTSPRWSMRSAGVTLFRGIDFARRPRGYVIRSVCPSGS